MPHIFPACRKQGMFCFWCVWGRPNIKDQQANVSNVSNVSAAEAAELDQLTANQSVNLSTCQPKATPPVTYQYCYLQGTPLMSLLPAACNYTPLRLTVRKEEKIEAKLKRLLTPHL